MRRLFGAFVSFWLDQTGALPGVSYDEPTKKHYGPFVRFAQAVCAMLAKDLHRAGADVTYVNSLRDVASNPVRVKTWLDAVTNLSPRKQKTKPNS